MRKEYFTKTKESNTGKLERAMGILQGVALETGLDDINNICADLDVIISNMKNRQ